MSKNEEKKESARGVLSMFYFLFFLPSLLFGLGTMAFSGVDNVEISTLGLIKFFFIRFFGTSFPIFIFMFYAALKNLLEIPVLESSPFL